MRRATIPLWLACAVALLPVAARAQFEPAGTGGVEALDLDLRRLGHVKRVLVVGAHPDDEDTDLLAWLARGAGAQVAYLSLTRGEGGQNLIGEELGVALGLLRSEELLAARRLDGAHQFFTRAYDFGYSKSEEEAFRFWPRDSVLKDVVRVIRRFRPQVVVSVFAPAGGGHGQHGAAGTVAFEAFRAAGDPARFPELATEEGLAPYAPLKLYRSARFDTSAATLRIPTGTLDPVVGRSYHQIAMASRSQHRSQDQGRLQEPGPSWTYVRLLEDRTGTGGAALFAGIDTAVASLAAGPARDALATFARWTDSARAALRVREPERAVPALARALAALRAALDALGAAPPELAEQEAIAERALLAAAGVVVDATVPDRVVTADDSLHARVVVWNAGPYEVELRSLRWARRPDVPAGAADDGPGSPRRPERVAPGTRVERSVPVPRELRLVPDRPYYLRATPGPGLYDWRGVPPEVRGLPFEPAPLALRFELAVAGTPVAVEREVAYRTGDQALGEVRAPVHVAPAIGVRVDPPLLVWPADANEPRRVTVTVTRHARGAGEAILALRTPPGWPAPPPRRVRFARENESHAVAFELRRPADARAGEWRIAAVARTPDGTDHVEDLAIVEYPHIRARATLDSAAVTVRVADIDLPPLRRVGYVRGAADRVPEALRAVGVPVEMLDDAALRTGDLRAYDAIVIGSRAYETNPVLAEANDRLLAYVRDGGLLLVQYQQHAFVQGPYAPYPLEIARPHDRVTDETAEPLLLEPDHPVFRRPNALGPADWSGWVQERGLYFASTWDPRYTPLLAFADPGEAPKRGVLLVARVGRGTYVYTGLAFFRQLPAGVPGAFRLFANLLALR